MIPHKKQLMLFLILPFFLFLLAAASQAQAAPVWRSTWEVSANFVSDKPNATLLVTVERQNNFGAWVLYDTEEVQLHCVTAPGVFFANDTAVFEGSGAIQCAMPSVRAMVRQMTKGRFTPDASCDCKGSPIILADVELDPNTTGSAWENPLVYRTTSKGIDMALSANIPAYSTIRFASMQFTVDGNMAQSNPFIANGTPNALSATYFNVGAALQPAFWANGADPGTSTPEVGSLAVSYEATTLTIGHSPVSGESLHGTLHSLDVDPGCYGTG